MVGGDYWTPSDSSRRGFSATKLDDTTRSCAAKATSKPPVASNLLELAPGLTVLLVLLPDRLNRGVERHHLVLQGVHGSPEILHLRGQAANLRSLRHLI